MAKKRRRKKKILTPEQQLKVDQRKLKKGVADIFGRVGFNRIETEHTKVEFGGGSSDFDQLFVGDGCIVLVEETAAAKSRDIRDHINKKVLFYQKLWSKERAFLAHLAKVFPQIGQAIPEGASISTFKLRVVYALRYPFEKENKPEFENIIFLRYEYLKHFLHLTKTIGRSSRFEIYKFLRLELRDVQPDDRVCDYKFDGFVLPESRSGFGDDFKIVTFYMDPASLIELGYSLRRDSWMDAEGLYQRILSPKKIRKMRAYLKNEGHVYVNNIIVGLPHDVQITDPNGAKINLEGLARVAVVKVVLPDRFNSIGLIDGQHRVYSYHEGKDSFEHYIGPKRKKQQLLVTGLIFPSTLSEAERLKREAKIFLEINAEQTSAKSELKQAIATIVSPFSSVAIAKSVISYMAKKGPLAGELHDHFYDEGLIKTASIISYGLKYLVDATDPTNPQSFISKWNRAKASKLVNEPDLSLREEYIAFCSEHLNRILGGFLANVPNEFRTAKNPDGRALSVTMLNGLLYCTRRLLQENRLEVETTEYINAFSSHGLNFARGHFGFKSSQWKSLGDRLAKNCFKIEPLPES